MSKETNVERILELPLLDLQQWINSNLSKESKHFNWLGLAEALAFEARKNRDINRKLQLAELSVRIYEWLSKHENPEQSDSFVNSANALRIYLLANEQIDFSHHTLGLKRVEDWFWNEINILPEEASELSKISRNKIEKGETNFSSNELEKMKLIRKIKNRLHIIRNLSKIDKVGETLGEINDWLKIADSLL